MGFDWHDNADVWDKVKEEVAEFEAEALAGDRERMESELGDVLFSIINAARKYGINPENALERTNQKFISRFGYVEKGATEKGRSLRDMSLEEMDALWDEAKSLEVKRQEDVK